MIDENSRNNVRQRQMHKEMMQKLGGLNPGEDFVSSMGQLGQVSGGQMVMLAMMMKYQQAMVSGINQMNGLLEEIKGDLKEKKV
jgi:hypothetical protein